MKKKRKNRPRVQVKDCADCAPVVPNTDSLAWYCINYALLLQGASEEMHAADRTFPGQNIPLVRILPDKGAPGDYRHGKTGGYESKKTVLDDKGAWSVLPDQRTDGISRPGPERDGS